MSSKDKSPEPVPPSLSAANNQQTMDSSRRVSSQTKKLLREQAEKIISENAAESPGIWESRSIEEIQHTFHELQVHQIQLEMQNDELTRTQDELEVAIARYFDLYDQAPVGYCTLSEAGLILEANLTAARMLGVARGELIRQPISRFIIREDQDSYYLFRKKLFSTFSALRQNPKQANSELPIELQDCELRMLTSDGREFWAHLQVTVSEDDGYAPVYRVVLSDISARKHEEEQRTRLEIYHRQLHKAESLERMAGAIAHIFNNQLCVVLGNLEMTLEDIPDDALYRQNLVNAMRAARRSSEISGLLLTYLGQTNTNSEPLDLSAVCRQNLPKIRASMPEDIVLEADLHSPGPVVKANRPQIQLVLTNLITNSWEAIGNRSGRVTVATKILPKSDIPQTEFSDPDWPSTTISYGLLEVNDTGDGMTEEELEKIFDPFFSTKFTGRGLGLAVVAGLVKAWGGMIGVKSVVGKGSSFRIFLPLVADVVPREIDPWAGALDFEIGDAVLLVEDEEMVRMIAEAMLHRLGFTVFAAADGNEAIALFKKHRESIRCVITDLKMAGMDGWETIAALRKIDPQLPAILSSGYDELEAMSGDYEELPQAFLHKPYELDDFKNVLGRVLGESIRKSNLN